MCSRIARSTYFTTRADTILLTPACRRNQRTLCICASTFAFSEAIWVIAEVSEEMKLLTSARP